MSSKKSGLCMVLVGIVILTLKLSFNTGLQVYPEYEVDYGIGRQFQSYTINYFYGANDIKGEITKLDVYYTGFRIDLLSNVIGYVLVIVGTIRLGSVSKAFSLSRLLAYIGLALSIIIPVLPFFFNGFKLCCLALFIGIAELFAAMSVSYLFVYAVCSVLSDIAFKTDRTYIGMSYIGMSVLMLVVAFVEWMSVVSRVLLGAYVILLAMTLGLLIFNIYKNKGYIINKNALV